MQNLKARIDGHNEEIHRVKKKKIFNHLKKKIGPMRGTWLTENVLYYAEISWNDGKAKPKLYKRIYGITFNKRYANHKKSFNVEKHKNYLLSTGN